MIYEQHDRLHFFKFDSVAETAAEAVRASKPYRGKSWDAIASSGSSFIGRSFSSYEQVQKVLNTRWDEGMRVYEQMMERLRQHQFEAPLSLKRRAVWDEDSGDELCLDRLRAAQPYWRTTRRQHRPGPLTVTIITDTAAAAKVPHLNILWRGAAAICLTEILEQAGYRVELWQAEKSTNSFATQSGWFACASLLKAPSDPLDVSTLINATSGWMERTIYFAVVSLVGQPADGDGTPAPIDDIAQYITSDEQVILCKGIWDYSKAIEWVGQQLENIKSGQFTTN